MARKQKWYDKRVRLLSIGFALLFGISLYLGAHRMPNAMAAAESASVYISGLGHMFGL